MKTYVALLRGINVGGKSTLPMKDLVTLLEDLGAQNVRTYIQSGNAVFRSEESNASLLSNDISVAIKMRHGLEPRVLLLETREFERVVESNPFPEAEPEPRTLHVYFLASVPPNPDLDALENLRGDDERFALKDGALYLYAPGGVGRSRLAANAERLLGVPATARNWRTVRKILALAQR